MLLHCCVADKMHFSLREEIYQAAQSKILVIPKPINTTALQHHISRQVLMLFITVELHLHQLLLLQTNIVALRYYFLSDEQNL